MNGVVHVTVVPWDHDDVARLRDEQQAEIYQRYQQRDIEPDLPPEEMLATLLGTVDGEATGCGSLRYGMGYGEGYGELKRMYVRPALRGRGLGGRILAELVRIAQAEGLTRLILETGELQPEAIRLYRRGGFRRIRNYGPYTDVPTSICYGRWLLPDAGTQVLVVNGTVGAGKTAVADAAAELLRERDVSHAWLDADVFRRVWPAPDGDPFARQVVLGHLAGIAPSLQARGYRYVVLAEVVEDAADREQYEAAFDGADVAIVRVTASEATRLARVAARETDEHWRDRHLARTVELEAILAAAALDDAVVDNDGRPLRDVAAEVLAAAGW